MQRQTRKRTCQILSTNSERESGTVLLTIRCSTSLGASFLFVVSSFCLYALYPILYVCTFSQWVDPVLTLFRYVNTISSSGVSRARLPATGIPYSFTPENDLTRTSPEFHPEKLVCCLYSYVSTYPILSSARFHSGWTRCFTFFRYVNTISSSGVSRGRGCQPRSSRIVSPPEKLVVAVRDRARPHDDRPSRVRPLRCSSIDQHCLVQAALT